MNRRARATIVFLTLATIGVSMLAIDNAETINRQRKEEAKIKEIEERKKAESETEALIGREVGPTYDTEDYENSLEPQYACKDVTSYDYNYDNDMLCKNLITGEEIYTSYEGASAYESFSY